MNVKNFDINSINFKTIFKKILKNFEKFLKI